MKSSACPFDMKFSPLGTHPKISKVALLSAKQILYTLRRGNFFKSKFIIIIDGTNAMDM